MTPLGDVRFVNPGTGAVTSYATTPLGLLGLLDQTAASANGATIPLTAVSITRPTSSPLSRPMSSRSAAK